MCVQDVGKRNDVKMNSTTYKIRRILIFAVRWRLILIQYQNDHKMNHIEKVIKNDRIADK